MVSRSNGFDPPRSSREILVDLIAALAREAARGDDAREEAERAKLEARQLPPVQSAQRSPDEPLLVPIKEAARLLGFSRQTLYRMREDGQIAFRKLRGRTMVPMSEIKRLAAAEPAAPSVSDQPTQALEPKRRPKKVKLYPREARRAP